MDSLGERALSCVWRARQLRLEHALASKHTAPNPPEYLHYAETWRGFAGDWIALARDRSPRSAEQLRKAAQAALSAANTAHLLHARSALTAGTQQAAGRGPRPVGAAGSRAA